MRVEIVNFLTQINQSLTAIARHIGDRNDLEPTEPHYNVAQAAFIDAYIDTYQEDFRQHEDGWWVYEGKTDAEPLEFEILDAFPIESGNADHGDSEDTDSSTEGDDHVATADSTDDDDKIRFTLDLSEYNDSANE